MLNYLLVYLLSLEFSLAYDNHCGDDCDRPSHTLYDREHNLLLKEYDKAVLSISNNTCDHCSCYINVIETDLFPFRNGIHKEMLEKCSSKGILYQLIDGNWHRSKDCLFPSRCEGVEYFLGKLKNELPNMELCFNFHDWPLAVKHYSSIIPVFSFSKTDDYYDIMYPAWSFWKGGPAIKLLPKGLGRWDLGRNSMISASKKWPWEKKINKAFFRGSRTSAERDTLVLISRKNSNIVDAAYTKNQAWKSDKDTLGLPPSDEVSLEDHCQYKYLFNFRGVTASFRFKYLFLCNSLVIHVGDEWNEFFYSALKPWVHYVPLSNHASDSEYRSLLDFLRHEEDIARSIATRGFNFIHDYLRIEDVLCYWKTLLLRYSELQSYKPTRNPDLILLNV